MVTGKAAEYRKAVVNENIPRLVELVGHYDDFISYAATYLLAASASPETIEQIGAALNGKSIQARAKAVAFLGKSGNPEALPYLRKLALSANESKAIRLSAVTGLGELGLDSAIPYLAGLLDDEDEGIQREALSALWAIGSQSAVAVLFDVCLHHQSVDWYSSCAKLAKLDRSQVAPLLAAISSQDLQMIAQAYPFYIVWGEEGSEAVLIQAFRLYGNKGMAEAFLNCDNDLLAEAAEVWAGEHGYIIMPSPGSGGVEWGSAR